MTLTLYRMPASALHEAGGDPEAIGALLDADHPQLDLDKGWNGLQFLLTGDTYLTTGLGAALMGGDEVGDDLGYGPARWLTPAEVAAVSEELAGADIDALRADWTNEAAEADGVYPSVWTREPDAVDTWIVPLVGRLRAFYAEATAAEQGVLMALL